MSQISQTSAKSERFHQTQTDLTDCSNGSRPPGIHQDIPWNLKTSDGKFPNVFLQLASCFNQQASFNLVSTSFHNKAFARFFSPSSRSKAKANWQSFVEKIKLAFLATIEVPTKRIKGCRARLLPVRAKFTFTLKYSDLRRFKQI